MMNQKEKIRNEVNDFLNNKKLERKYVFRSDTPTDTPYKSYDPTIEASLPILIKNSANQIKEISEISELVKGMIKKQTLIRYYFPENLRDEINKIASNTLN